MMKILVYLIGKCNHFIFGFSFKEKSIMQKYFNFSLFSILFLVLPFQNYAQEKKLKVERNHSSISFTIPIGKITAVRGMFNDFNIEMDIDNEDLTTAKVKAIIQTKSITTGIPARDDHLRTADFFDAEKYPEIIFESEDISRLEGENYLAKGTITLHGISKEMEIPFTYNGDLGKNTLGFSAKFIINRLDFEIAKDFEHDSIPEFLGSEVKVEVDFWTKKRKDKK